MNYITINNWEKYQHYTHRNPPWVKLHNSLLDDYEYGCLQDASKLLLISLYMLASKCENRIPADPKWIREKGMLSSNIELEPLVNAGFISINGDASEVLAQCKHDESKMVVQSRVEKSRDREEKDMQVSPALLFPLQDGTEYPLELTKISQYEKTYHNIDVQFELKKCLQWDIDRPKERKTKTGILKHINFWLNRASKDKGPAIQPGIEYDNTAVEEARRDAKEMTPEQRAKNIARIRGLADMVGKREGR